MNIAIYNSSYIEKISYDKKRGNDIFGNNMLLRKIGFKKFKSIKQSLLEYKR